jgi:glutamyl-tRNA synthetase
VELADWVQMAFVDVEPVPAERELHFTPAAVAGMVVLRERLAMLPVWDKASIAVAFKDVLASQGLKMPQLAPAVRVAVCGRAQTPSIDAVLAWLPQNMVLRRLGGV